VADESRMLNDRTDYIDDIWELYGALVGSGLELKEDEETETDGETWEPPILDDTTAYCPDGFTPMYHPQNGTYQCDDTNTDCQPWDCNWECTAGCDDNWDPCDLRLKENIDYTYTTQSGINVYLFEYKDKEGLWIGPMAQELPTEAVKEIDGYLRVNFNKLPSDVPFKRVY